MAPDFARAIHMNNEQFPFQKLDSYKVAREFARRVHEAKIKDAELRDQATRAAKSAFLGLCEGLPSDAAGIRRRHFDIANNSLHEAVGAIDLAAAIRAIDEALAQELITMAARLRQMLRGLMR
jgi:four helix bundle protein